LKERVGKINKIARPKNASAEENLSPTEKVLPKNPVADHDPPPPRLAGQSGELRLPDAYC